jgi:hypothetical protein
MKKILIAIFILFFIVSCKKSPSGGTNNTNTSNKNNNTNNNNTDTTVRIPVNPSWDADATPFLAAVRNYYPGDVEIDSLEYDATHHVTRYLQYDYDTANNAVDSFITVFSYDATINVPKSYTRLSTNDFSDGAVTHLLNYDSLGRIIEDSSLNTSSPSVTNFTYTTNMLSIVSRLGTGVGVNADYVKYFLVEDANGNVTSDSTYYTNLLVTVGSALYSSNINPRYHINIEKTIGPLLDILVNYHDEPDDYIGDVINFTSINLFDNISRSGSPSLSLTITTDGQGRAVESMDNIYNFRVIYSYY